MEHVKNTIQNYQPRNQETLKPESADDRLMQRFWQKMMELYGRQWESSYGLEGGEAYITWSEAFAGLKPGQIKNGIDALVYEGNEFPPNLIKFLRLCRKTQPAYHQTAMPALPKKRPNYSVMRIEKAKQKLLTGESFKAVDVPRRFQLDWTADDEEALFILVENWDRSTGHAGLNDLIDDYNFSGGKHSEKSRKSGIVQYDLGNGDIQTIDKTCPFDNLPYKVNGIEFEGNLRLNTNGKY